MDKDEDRGLTSHIGSLEIDWPRTIGYYGGIALAVGFELIEPPLAIFIAAVPIFKMLNRPKASFPARLAAHVVDGAAKPVGGDADATIHIVAPTAQANSTRNA
jgi:hypothetical protein